MNNSMDAADMLATAHTKNATSRYFSPRSGRSSHRGKGTLPPKKRRPARQRYSETVPTGHNQLQNAFRNKKEIATKTTNRNNAAGCVKGTWPVLSQYFRFISPAIGSQPSTPGGRSMVAPSA